MTCLFLNTLQFEGLYIQFFERYKPNDQFKIAALNSDYINKEIFSNGIYEISLLEKLKGIIVSEKAFGTYVDVGANIGNHTIYFSKIAKEVIAFEPNPVCYNLIRANLLANKMQQRYCYRQGC